MKKLLYLFLLLIFASCGNKSNSDSSNNATNPESDDNSVYYADIAIEGYNTGYEHGANDGWNDNYKSSFTLSCKYLFDEEKSNYESGYKKGYDEGFKAGKAAYNKELAKRTETARQVLEEYESSNVTVSTTSTPNTYSSPNTSTAETDFHNWEEDEIRAFYVEIEDCESDEKAEYISNEYYLGEYIQEGYRYFAKTSVKNGTYEAEVGEKVSSKLFKIKGTDVFMLFKWLPNASKWDEGILDVWANKGSFYKKPN